VRWAPTAALPSPSAGARHRFSTLASRIALVMLAAHGVLLPALFFGLMRGVERALADQFIAQVRGFSRAVADEFELGDALDSVERSRALLDSAILRGDGVYAELRGADINVRSELGPAGIQRPKHPNLDVDVAQGGDQIYFLMLPVEHAGKQAELWLGFDEAPTMGQIGEARSRILIALGAYFALTMAPGVLVGYWLSRPLIGLRQRSKRVASGDYKLTLGASSSLREVVRSVIAKRGGAR